MNDELKGIINDESEFKGIISNEGKLKGVISNESELRGVISNEGELEGVLEDNSFNVKVQIMESGPRGLPGSDGYTPIKGVDYFDGEQGPKGDQGEVGPKGDTGDVGPKGDKGDTGEQGQRGLQGPKGDPFVYDDFTPTQLEGLKGPQGIQGPKGDKGDTGEQGIQGIQGPKGDDGYTPIKGIDYFDGEQGPRGDKGETGDPGVGLQYKWVGSKLGIKTETESDFEYVNLVAASGDITYTHHQISASQEWLVCHNLGKHPSVTVVDSASTVVVGDIEYLNTEELIIRFTSEFSGRAFLN